MVEAQVVPLEPPDPSPPDVSLLLQMQPLARALTFSAVCTFSDTSISSLPWPLLHFEANSVDEKPIVIFSPMNMIVASSDVPFVSYLEQSHFPIFPLIWSELDEQASLVLQGSSSHRMLFSASGAVCVVLWVTLDAIFREAYEAVFDTISYGSSCDLYRHSIYRFDTISYGLFFCLARSSFYVSSFDGV
ncbi:BnaCnng49660D [Brassica napus]|uniref:BnaCnng49660D protein n=1 Tax=Brassica napus TaxID=3708 RepID=A0A078JL95_BRANA|nr:BnaCnng49660D [Brassica napus]